MDVVIAPIVEGYGDVEAVPVLIRRVWQELLGGAYAHVLKPIRQPRSKLLPNRGASTEPNIEAFDRAVGLATRELCAVETAAPRLILILLDADRDCPATLAPTIRAATGDAAGQIALACVLAVVEFETWLVGGAQSLGSYLNCGEAPPPDPERSGVGKGWIQHRIRRTSYRETVDQPRLTAAFDLAQARKRCPSFDKLCRVLERFAPGSSDHSLDTRA
jgi:hypothetical protein